MKTEELIECGRLLELEKKRTIDREQALRLITLKATAKKDLPVVATTIVKKQIAEVLARQIATDTLKALELCGQDTLKIALPLLITTLTSSIKKA